MFFVYHCSPLANNNVILKRLFAQIVANFKTLPAQMAYNKNLIPLKPLILLTNLLKLMTKRNFVQK